MGFSGLKLELPALKPGWLVLCSCNSSNLDWKCSWTATVFI